VDKNIYEDEALPRFQNPDDKSDYMPLVSQVKSKFYRTLPRSVNNKFVKIMEVFYSFNEIDLDDSIFQLAHWFAKTKFFMNVNSVRILEDKTSSYVD
jgi:hypothetical protein